MAKKRLQTVERKQVTARLPEVVKPKLNVSVRKDNTVQPTERKPLPKLPERRSPNVVKPRLPDKSITPVRTSEKATLPKLPERQQPTKTYRLPQSSFQRTFAPSGPDKVADQVREMANRIGGKLPIAPMKESEPAQPLPLLKQSEHKKVNHFRHGS